MGDYRAWKYWEKSSPDCQSVWMQSNLRILLQGKFRMIQYERVDFDTICRESDLLSIHAPLNNATENLMNKDAFQKMKKSAVLINVGRAPIVNEEDLVEALENGEIAAAGLDVISAEPMREENPLMKIKDSGKLVVTPHIAWASTEARQRLVREVYLNIEAFLERRKEKYRLR